MKVLKYIRKPFIETLTKLWVFLVVMIIGCRLFNKAIPFPYEFVDSILNPIIKLFYLSMWIIAVLLIWPYRNRIGSLLKIFTSTKKSEKLDRPTLIEDTDEADKIIRKFEKKCKNRKALMIQAPWGYGKTSFYQKSLKPKIEKKYPDANIAEISCFGIKTVDDLVAQILNKLFFTEFLSILLSFVKALLSTSTHFKKILIPAETIIVIDDFERIYPHKGFYTELFGFIDYLVREKKCLVFILCNENEIETEKDEYPNFHEKIVNTHNLEITKEVLEKIIRQLIIETENNAFYDETAILENISSLINKTKNIRNARDTLTDLKRFGNIFSDRINNFFLDQEIKKYFLKLYFDRKLEALINVFSIRNFNKSSPEKTIEIAFKNAIAGNTPISIEDEVINSIIKEDQILSTLVFFKKDLDSNNCIEKEIIKLLEEDFDSAASYFIINTNIKPLLLKIKNVLIPLINFILMNNIFFHELKKIDYFILFMMCHQNHRNMLSLNANEIKIMNKFKEKLKPEEIKNCLVSGPLYAAIAKTTEFSEQALLDKVLAEIELTYL